MDFLSVPHLTKAVNGDRRLFYLSSCESAAEINEHGSNSSSRRSSRSSCSSTDDNHEFSKEQTNPNLFLETLTRLHSSKIRREKSGRFRSQTASLHLFFKKTRPTPIEYQLCKSSSTEQIQLTNSFQKTNRRNSLQLFSKSGEQRKSLQNSKTFLLQHRRNQTSDHTVSEDNNTNTLSSVDLTPNYHCLPTLIVTESFSSVRTDQQTKSSFSIDIKSVSWIRI